MYILCTFFPSSTSTLEVTRCLPSCISINLDELIQTVVPYLTQLPPFFIQLVELQTVPVYRDHNVQQVTQSQDDI